jgi:hypothetical protein
MSDEIAFLLGVVPPAIMFHQESMERQTIASVEWMECQSNP